MYRLAEHPPSQALDVQILYRDGSEILRQPERELVLKLMPLILNSLVNFLQQRNRFTMTVGTFLTACDFALSTAQLCFRFLIPAVIWNRLAIRHGSEPQQTNVDSNFLGVSGKWFRLTFNRKTGVPLTTFSLDGDRLNLAADRTVQFDLDLPDTLNAQQVIVQLDAVAVTRERNAIESMPTFEPRIASLFATLGTAKERIKRLANTVKDVLAAREVRQPEVTSGSNLLKLVRLVVVVDRDSLLPRITAFFERCVVQTARLAQLQAQQFALERGCE
jgi:hypothetical protein